METSLYVDNKLYKKGFNLFMLPGGNISKQLLRPGVFKNFLKMCSLINFTELAVVNLKSL